MTTVKVIKDDDDDYEKMVVNDKCNLPLVNSVSELYTLKDIGNYAFVNSENNFYLKNKDVWIPLEVYNEKMEEKSAIANALQKLNIN